MVLHLVPRPSRSFPTLRSYSSLILGPHWPTMILYRGLCNGAFQRLSQQAWSLSRDLQGATKGEEEFEHCVDRQ